MSQHGLGSRPAPDVRPDRPWHRRPSGPAGPTTGGGWTSVPGPEILRGLWSRGGGEGGACQQRPACPHPSGCGPCRPPEAGCGGLRRTSVHGDRRFRGINTQSRVSPTTGSLPEASADQLRHRARSMRELLTLDSSSRDLCRRCHSEGLVSQVGLRTRSDAEQLWQSREARSTVAGIVPPSFLVTRIIRAH